MTPEQELEQPRQTVAILQQNAARYEFLRKLYWHDNTLAVVLRPKDNCRLGTLCPSGAFLDEWVDKFMTESQGGQQ